MWPTKAMMMKPMRNWKPKGLAHVRIGPAAGHGPPCRRRHLLLRCTHTYTEAPDTKLAAVGRSLTPFVVLYIQVKFGVVPVVVD